MGEDCRFVPGAAIHLPVWRKAAACPHLEPHPGIDASPIRSADYRRGHAGSVAFLESV